LTVLVMIILIIAMFWLERDGLKDGLDGDVSFIDTVYFAMVTITTVGYGDIVPVSERARLLDALLVTPARLFIWLIFIGTAYQFVVERIIEDTRMRIRQVQLRDHVVICGFGHSGRCAAAEFARRGVPGGNIVVIDESETALRDAADLGYLGLRGDSTREDILTEACVGRARVVVVCVGRDDTAVLSVLTVRHLAPDVRVVASAREVENEKLLVQSGADAIVSPAAIAGSLLAGAAESSQVVEYVTDLVSAGGRITLQRREAGPEDFGKRYTEIADGVLLRIHRGPDMIGFWQPEAIIQPGDVLLVVVPHERQSGRKDG
ncbi:MAG: potassium channel family protein, partial [Gammaproteobacteria bacterium]|nr:potassium channel family protein [Gammaproteobacteria bacterium]